MAAGLHFDAPAPELTSGKLTINSTSMHCAAWDVLDCTPLWPPGSPPARGRDIIIPGAEGRLIIARRRDEWKVTLPMGLSGVVDPTGVTPYADYWTGLATNLAALVAAIGPIPGASAQSATLDIPGVTGLTENVIVEELKLGNTTTGGNPFTRATLTLTLVLGGFVA